MTPRLLLRRARAQLPLLSAVVALVTIGATLLGVCVLLLTVSQDQALNEGLAQAEPEAVSVTAYVIEVPGEHAASVVADTRAAMVKALAPLPIATTDSWASSGARPLVDRSGPDLQIAYFSAIDDLEHRTRVVTGRLPRPAEAGASGAGSDVRESALLESTARRLGVNVGDQVRLGPENSLHDPDKSTKTVTIVGILQPLDGTGWDRDPMAGAGYDRAFNSSQYARELPGFGPFILDQADLWSSGGLLDNVQVSVQPDLSHPNGPALEAASEGLAGLDLRVKALLGNRADNERTVSALPATLDQVRFQQEVTRSTVLVVVLLGTVVTAAALALAGRLMVALRSRETALFSAMGAGRLQLVAQAATEALTLAAVATVLAVPLSSLAHFGLTHLPRLADAGLAAPVGVTLVQVATVLSGALLLATVLVLPALRPDPARTTRLRAGLSVIVRSGADLLLLVLAGAGWWQLHDQPAGVSGTDTVRVVAPVLCLLAGAAVAPRLVALPLRFGERLARNARGLTLPLAAFEAARRPQAVAAGLLLALAAASGTFALAFSSTWERSQQDQAASRVGTDLAINVTGPVRPGQAATLAAATGGRVSAVTDRPVVLGHFIGEDEDVPRLLAVDGRQAGALVRGRLPDGQTWSGIGAQLAPGDSVTGLKLATAQEITVTAGVLARTEALQAVVRLVLQDGTGLRTECVLPVVLLDGRPHQRPLCTPPTPGTQIIGVNLGVELRPGLVSRDVEGLGVTQVVLELGLPATERTSVEPQEWSSTPVGTGRLPIPSADTAEIATDEGTVLRTKATLDLRDGLYLAEVVLTPFEALTSFPAVVSQRAADTLQLEVGSLLTVSVGTDEVSVRVIDIIPTVPSVPEAVAVMVDADALSRHLIVKGDLEPPVDAFWVGTPTRPDAAARAADLNLGSVVSLPEVRHQLSSGPLRVGVPASLLVLVPAVILLALAGTVMHVTSDVEARAVEIARLRGLGLTRRTILGGLLAQHGGLLLLLLGCGAGVGLLTSFAVAPLLVRSEQGAEPVPSALASWPWSGETVLLGVLLLAGIAAVALVVTIQLRRADAAHLRVGA